MLRILALVGVLALAAVPATAAVVVDPDPVDTKTLFTAEGITGNGAVVGGSFELTKNAPVTISVSGSGALGATITLAQITGPGGFSSPLEIVNFPPAVSFAFVQGLDLVAGTYQVLITGNFRAASLSGEVSAVPIPGALVLFGSAMAGLAYVRRRRSADAA